MLTREEAQRLLESEANKAWRDQALAAIASDLADDLRPIAYGLLGYDADGTAVPRGTRADLERHRRLIAQAQAHLAELAGGRRPAIFTALLPGIAPYVAAGWLLHDRLPYQTGYQRKAFRRGAGDTAPEDARLQWLQALVDGLGPYRLKDVVWLAAWAPYLGGYLRSLPRLLGILFAAAIDAGGSEGEAVFETLTASASGEHPIGAVGRHVTTGLLTASRPDGWAFIERLLLAAQREEGLRQVILETVDEAHPEAFRRMLGLILDENLVRFSSTIRAADVWFGCAWDVDQVGAVRETLAEVRTLLDDPEARAAALTPRPGIVPHEASDQAVAPSPLASAARKAAAEQALAEARSAARRLYLGLWAIAFEDVQAAVEAAGPLLSNADPLCRLAVAHLLGQLGLPRASAALLPLLDDADLRVALRAFQAMSYADDTLMPDLFERYERLLARLDDKRPRLESGLWPWLILNAYPSMVADELNRVLGDRSPMLLLPHLPRMSAWRQVAAAKLLAALPTWDAPIRETFLRMAADRSSYIRGEAFKLIASRPITEEEALPLERLLTRKSSDTRRAVLTMLLKQPDQVVFTAAERLLAARDPLRRLAGLDLLRELATADRVVSSCKQAAHRYREARSALSTEEQTLLDAIDASGRPARTTPTLENVLGLIDPADLTPPVPPRRLSVRVDTSGARACLALLDELIEQHRATPVIVKGQRGGDEQLLGNMVNMPGPDPKLSAREDAANLPLADLWLRWDRERPASSRDDDGLELARALLLVSGGVSRAGATPWWETGADPGFSGVEAAARLRYKRPAIAVLIWLERLREPPSPAAADLLLDCLETALARISRHDFDRWIAAQAVADQRSTLRDPRDGGGLDMLPRRIAQHVALHPAVWTEERHVRRWRLLHWLDQPVPGAPRRLPDLGTVLRAHQAGVASEADLLDHLVAPVRARQPYYGWATARDLRQLTARSPHPLLDQYPVLRRLLSLLRDRILEIEPARGEMPTPATPLALSLRHAGGLSIFLRLIGALGSGDLVRGHQSSSESRTGTLSHLLRATYPAPEDSQETFARRIAEARIPPKLLVAAAVYAPQWARYVEHALGRPSFEEAVWWIHAHTKDAGWTVDSSLREAWQAQVSERTPLNGQDLVDGAVDVAWFQRSYQGLGATRWNEVYAAAKYASSGAGHTRARLFADAMIGAVAGADLRRRIADKRHQDAVRALGLLPLPAGSAEARQAEVTERYQAIQEFVRTGRQFGAQRRASEELAARVGLDNLARLAGYADPIRLQWAMEGRLVADLRDGSPVVEDGEVRVTLSINALSAEPEIEVRKNGTLLKTLPARLKKNEAIVALYARKREIERQVSRMRRSLEDAMCRGDHFTAAELSELLRHPVLSRLLRNLVFIEDNAAYGRPDMVLGYPVPNPACVPGDAALDRARAPRPSAPQPQIPPSDPEAAPERAFAYKDEKSDKFWRIRVEGATFVVNFGRAGAVGAVQRKEFVDEAAARREAARLIREKTAKGYIETTPPSTSEAAREHIRPATPVNEPVVHAEHSAAPTPVNPASVGADAPRFRSHDGSTTTVDQAMNNLRLAHPHDLLRDGAWHAWQHDCFTAERIQPFKQVFRELYVVTQNETRNGKETASFRYAGQQVQPRQALALFDRRGWVNSQEEGLRRTFHNTGITAWVSFDAGYLTPAEVEGLTIDRVLFTPRTDWQPIPLAEVPPRIFSEVMRDLDLVVSVAHRGGVDPEASASTVEMRATLLAETCALLRLRNVTIKSAHALIEGTLGSYSVHLGSAVVHRQPGGALCIVPVHSQHRGRLFLPFADDDPRTAEVVSKVVLLARDGEIKDPSILEQIL